LEQTWGKWLRQPTRDLPQKRMLEVAVRYGLNHRGE
jgi:hypothetical protein